MRQSPWLFTPAAVSVLLLTSCGDQPTEPHPADQQPVAPATVPASNTWLTKRDMPFGRLDLTTAVVPNASGQSILYAIGGAGEYGVSVDSVDAYNVATNVWSRKARLPIPLLLTNGAGVINGKIYVSGGILRDEEEQYPVGTLYVYDPRTNTWTQKAYMPEMGAMGVTGVINGKLYVASTCFEAPPNEFYFISCDRVEGGRSWATNFFRYNPVTDRWARLPHPKGEYHMGGVLYGKFYVTDGKQVEVYDPSTNQWTTKGTGPQVRRYAAATVLWGRLYLMGGTTIATGYEAVRTTAIYHPLTDKWTTAAQMPTARSNVSASRVDLNGKSRIEVVGGNAPGNNLQYIP
jgi:N-acetylneuraminic acid mutarotase